MIHNCKCGKPAHHTTYWKGRFIYQCCECYVKEGNPPADWHPDCMNTYARLHPEKVASSETK